MSRIIVLDEGGFKHSAIFVHMNNEKMSAVFTYLRMIFGRLKLLKATLEDVVIIAHDWGSWRKKEDPNYKRQRQQLKEQKKPPEWWTKQYNNFNDFYSEMEISLPFHHIKKQWRESDDVASCVCKYYKDDEKILISSDGDWKMLCAYPNTRIFSLRAKKFIDVPNPYAILQEKLKGDKCLEGRTPIVMANDTRKMIKDLKKNELVATYNFKKRQIENQPIIAINKSLSYKRILIYLDKEKVPLKVTPEHKLYTKRGYVEAKKIRCSDVIYKYNELKYMIKTNISHNFYKLGYLHGYLIGDGSITKYKEITYTSVDVAGLERIKKYLIDLFNYPVSINIAKKENWKPNRKRVYEINIKNNLKDNFFKYFMLNFCNRNKTTRKQYYRGFVAGFFDAEGSCYPKILNLKNGNQRIVWDVNMSNTNINYIKYVCNCLKLFNVHFKIYSRIIKSKKIIYKIELTNTTKNINFFLLFRPAIDRKYPDLKILSNGKTVRNIKTAKPRYGNKFVNYNIKTKNRNFFAKDVLVHNSDNLLAKPSSEADFQQRKRIVDLINLPFEISEPIIEELKKIQPKNIYLEKIRFKAVRKQCEKLYNL
jgi:hypothetical protein